MRATSLEKALPAIAGFFTDRTGIEVVRGHRAATDNKVIYLPRRRSELDLSEKDLVENVAYLYHEGGHMLHSNFELAATSPLQRAITGALEDIRIEHLVMGKLPGARRYLSRLMEIMVQEGAEGRRGFPALSGEESESSILQRYILYRLRHEALRQEPMQGVSESAISVARSKLPTGMLTRLDALMFQVTDCASEDEVFELADAIISMIKEEKEKEEEERKQQQQQDAADQPEQSGEDGEAEAESNDSSSGDSEQSEAGDQQQQQDADEQSASSTGSESESEADNEAGDSTSSSGAGDAEEEDNAAESLENILSMSDNDVEENLGEMLEAALNEAAANEPYYGSGCARMPNKLKANIRSVDADLAAIRGSINAIRTKTLQWMESVSEEEVVHSRSGMQIDSSRIWSARFGGSVFVRKDEGIDLNAAVSIVVDRSGSMMGIIGQAAQAAVATMLAFDVPGIKTQVTVFPWFADGDEGVAVIKGWKESPRSLAGKVSNLTVDGGTPMAEAILFAASDIVRRDESLKIILVLTDGDPDDVGATQQVIERARQAGVTVLALGIGVDPSRVFTEKYAATITDVGAMSSSMVRLIKTAFEDRKSM